MKDSLLSIIKKIVDYPEDVRIKERQGQTGIIFEILVRDSDKGKIIGKQGRTIKAIRNIMTTVGKKKGEYKVNIEIIG